MNVGMNMEALFKSVIAGAFKKGTGIVLQVGQMVKGVLIEMLSEREAMFLIQGQPVRATLEAVIPANEEIWFQVMPSKSSSRILLKPFSELQAMDTDPIASILKYLRLPSNEINRSSAAALMRNGLPVTSESIAQIQKVVRLLPDVDVSRGIAVQAGVELIRRNIPLLPATVQSLAAALDSPHTWSDSWQQLKDAVTKWIGSDRQLGLYESQPSVTSVTKAGVSPASSIASQLLDIMTRMESVADKAVRSGNVSQAQQGAPMVAPSAGDGTLGGQPIGRPILPPDANLKIWLKALGFIQGDYGPHSASPTTNPSTTDSLKQVLSSLMNAPDVPASVKEAALPLSFQINGHQLLSLPNADMNQPPLSVFQFPFSTGRGESGTVYVQSRTKKGKGLTLDQCSLFFYLTMPYLGETWVEVDIQHKTIDIRVRCERSEMKEVANDQRSGLEDSLNAMGYGIRSWEIVALPHTEGMMTPSSVFASSKDTQPYYKGVDYRV